MSSATATADAPAKPSGGNGKKLFLIIGILVLLLTAAGGAAVFLLKKKAHAEDDGASETAAHAAPDLAHPPTFVPLDPFVVNLADRETDRYAQIGVSLEVADAKAAESIKSFMPAIRNNVLMVLSHKTSADLLAKDGKKQLATEIRVEATRALGYEVRMPRRKTAAPAAADSAAAADASDEQDDEDAPRRPRIPGPVRGVQFSNFIIQ